jgi:hypothetical protein
VRFLLFSIRLSIKNPHLHDVLVCCTFSFIGCVVMLALIVRSFSLARIEVKFCFDVFGGCFLYVLVFATISLHLVFPQHKTSFALFLEIAALSIEYKMRSY